MSRKYPLIVLRWLWSLLPLSINHRQAARGLVFKYFPAVLDWVLSNRSWHKLLENNMGSFDLHDSGVSPYVPLLNAEAPKNKVVRLICFYLPQFHSIPENDKWWGGGFTEWSNVRPAEPQFVGHYQPHIPGELGYYNLLDPGVQRRQIELAKLYGIEGFCFYFYWFAGTRLLETPIQNYLKDDSLDLPFCLCWANENWSRRWDGLDNDILIAQQHSPEDDIAFIQHVSQYMRESRYIQIDNKPLLLVYRPSSLPSAKETSVRWRQWCRDHGMGEIYLAYTQAFETVDPVIIGFDAAIEFPPINASLPNVTSQIQPLQDDFACNGYDWNVFVERSQNYKKPNYNLFRGVCPSWDNTARRNNKSSILLKSSPRGYQQWLFNAISDTVERFSNRDQRLIFINAWNEWAEGAHLEPDQRYGYAYLEATRMALARKTMVDSLQAQDKNRSIAVVIHAFYEDVFDEILTYLENIHSISLKLYITTPMELYESICSKLQQQRHDFIVMPVSNRGRDILPFLKILPAVLQGKHDLLIKVHTKKSAHRQDGDIWRKDIYNKLLSDTSIADNISYLINNSDIGILGPTDHIVPMSLYLSQNAVRVVQLSARMGIERTALKSLSFVAGTMFIARTQSFIPLMNIALAETDFEEEARQVDGTLAHVLERVFTVSALSVGLKVSCPAKKIIGNYRYTKKLSS